jgi:hypothetical protein
MLNSLQLLPNEIINEAHALFDTILIAIVFNVSHHIEKFIQGCSILGKGLCEIDAGTGVKLA